MKCLIFLPTYNEKENLAPLVEEIISLNLPINILIVDDNSPDGTGEIADELAKKYSNVITVCHRKNKRGRGYAGIYAFKYAAQLSDIDVLIEMDADFSHQPCYIPEFLSHLKEYDIVIGSRYIEGGRIIGWNWKRYLNSFVANLLSRLILGLPFKDCTSGFRAFKIEVIRSLPLDFLISPGPSIVEEILFYCVKQKKYKIKEIPILFLERKAGKSKISIPIIFRWIISLLRVRLVARKINRIRRL